MVVFTCGHCGESVQKPKVEKHYMTKCRNKNPNLSCMDCFKDFYGNDYEAHTKCVTEAQRYSGKGFVAKQPVGEQKQNVWVEMIKDVINENPNAPKSVLKIIETVSHHSNTPRKKPKFFNFVQNVCRSQPHDVDAAWDLLSVKLTALAALRNNQNTTKKVENDETMQINGHSSEKKKENESISEENIEMRSENTLPKKQKKEKKKKIEDHDNEITIENNNESNDKKESSKKRKNTEDTVDEITNSTETVVDDNNEKKLSKKERKELKKQKKYEAELESINQTEKIEIDPNEEDDATSLKKKKKKNKENKQEIENEIQTDNKKSKKRKLTNGSGNIDENDVDKKKKKSADDSELDKSHIVLNETVEVQEKKESTKFSWHEIIITLLRSKDNEMNLKKLQKKVLAEYVTVTGEEATDRIAEKLLKKIKSASNVRIEKNKVLLTA